MAKLKVWLTAETKQFQRSLRKADQAVAQWSAKAKRYALAGGAAVAGLGAMSVKAAIDAQETRNKFDTVFKGIGGAANQAANQLRKSYGMGAEESQKLLAGTGDLLTGLGMNSDAALDMSMQVQTLSADLASFQNLEGGAQQASEALTKALLGERESVKALGIVIQEKMVNEKVAANAAKGMTFETELQAKAYATLQLAQEQSKNALGDYARTQDGAANQMRLAKTRVKDLQQAFGSMLMEIGDGGALKTFNEKLLEITDWMNANGPQVAFMIKSMYVEAKFALKQTWNALDVLGFNMLEMFSTLKTNFGTLINWIGNNWTKLFTNMPRIVKNALSNIKNSLGRFDYTLLSDKTEVQGIFRMYREGYQTLGQSANNLLELSRTGLIDKEELRQYMAALKGIELKTKSVFDGTDLTGPNFIKGNYRDMIKEVGKIEADKERDLAKLKEDLNKRLAIKAAADLQNAVKQTGGAIPVVVTPQGKSAKEIFTDQFLRIGGMLGNVNRAASPEREMRKQTSIQERIAEGIQRLRDAMTAAKPRFV